MEVNSNNLKSFIEFYILYYFSLTIWQCALQHNIFICMTAMGHPSSLKSCEFHAYFGFPVLRIVRDFLRVLF